MKLKGIWITICLIVVAGVCATSYTRQYTAAEPLQETALDSGFGVAPAAEYEGASQEEGRMAAADEPVAAYSGDLASAVEAESTGPSAVMQELEELDEQIARSHTGEQDTTTNSMKATADNERKLWDAKLNKFLDKLEEQLPANEKESLFLEQKEWIRDKESQAVAVSRKQSGSALQELEYNIFLKEITRTRVYELAEKYEEILSETE